MKKLLLLVALCIMSAGTAQILPETGDSIYYSPKYCDTAGSVEEAMSSWAFSATMQDCFNPSEAMLNALWPLLVVKDTYDCCCKVASTPGLPSSWTGFEGSACESYLEMIGWSGFEDNLGMNENIVNQLDGVYIDMYGRQYNTMPRGLSIKNKKKYYKL